MGRPIHGPHDREFRARAVKLVRSVGLSKVQVARDFGANAETLWLWIKQAEIDAVRRNGLATDETAELARLRREVAVLKEECEILQKAEAFFVREGAPR